MARKYDKYRDSVESFNNHFNVNFSFEEFERAINKYDFIAHDFNVPLQNGVCTEDAVYRLVFSTLFRKYVESIMEFEEDSITGTTAEFAREFEDLMEQYREANNSELPHELGGWQDEHEMVEAMRETLNSMNFDRNEHMKNQYLAGKIRLRDMRATVKEVENHYNVFKFDKATDKEGNIEYRDVSGNVVDPNKYMGITSLHEISFAKIMTCVAALEEVVASRSGWWKFFHPFRNNAEQRDLRAMKAFLEKYSNKPEYSRAEEALRTEDVKAKMLEDIENKFVAKIDAELDNEERLDKINEEAGKFMIGYKAYYVNEEPAPQEIPEGKHLVDKNLLKVNYVPDAENIEKELEELEKVQDHLKSMAKEDPSNEYSDYVSADGQKMEYQNYHFMKDVVTNNIKKINDVKADSVDEIKENIEAAVADGLPYHDMDKIHKIIDEEYAGLDEEEIMKRMLTDHKDLCDEQSANQWSSRNEKIMDDVDKRENKRQGALGIYINGDDVHSTGRENDKEVMFPNIIVSDEPRKVQVDPKALKNEVDGKANDDKVSNIIEDDNLSKSSISLNN